MVVWRGSMPASEDSGWPVALEVLWAKSEEANSNAVKARVLYMGL